MYAEFAFDPGLLNFLEFFDWYLFDVFVVEFERVLCVEIDVADSHRFFHNDTFL